MNPVLSHRLSTHLACVNNVAIMIQYDGPSVKEKINLSLFSFPFIGERKYIFEFIFTPVYWGVKNNNFIFSFTLGPS